MALQFLFGLALAASPAPAAVDSPSHALAAAVFACESWIMEPAAWIDGAGAFPTNIGLSGSGLVETQAVPSAAEAPPEVRLRGGLHHFRLPFAHGIVWLTTSDVLPFCHAAAIADPGVDLQLETMLSDSGFSQHWTMVGDSTRQRLRTRIFAPPGNNALTLVATGRANSAPADVDALVLLTMNLENR